MVAIDRQMRAGLRRKTEEFRVSETSTRNRAGVRDPKEADYVRVSMRRIMTGRGFVDYSENGEQITDRQTHRGSYRDRPGLKIA